MLKAGLLGYPIEHSLSPVIHRCAYRELGLDWEYELYSCHNLESFSTVLRDAKISPESYVGFNVTTPYKVAAFQAADAFSRFANIAGNANVLTFARGAAAATGEKGVTLLADNTDGRGLVESLKRESGRPLKGASVILCGSGAVAMSALLSLLEEEISSVTIACRNVSVCKTRVESVMEAATPRRAEASGTPCTDNNNDAEALLECHPKIQIIELEEAPTSLATADFLIDATTVGMNPKDTSIVPASALHSGLVVLDVVYGHGETALLRAAREAGAQALDGLSMLIEQAALTVELWAKEQGLELEAPREAMKRSVTQ
jgi:shikimate dehydrogenase